jgi:hypothetical protein
LALAALSRGIGALDVLGFLHSAFHIAPALIETNAPLIRVDLLIGLSTHSL